MRNSALAVPFDAHTLSPRFKSTSTHGSALSAKEEHGIARGPILCEWLLTLAYPQAQVFNFSSRSVK